MGGLCSRPLARLFTEPIVSTTVSISNPGQSFPKADAASRLFSSAQKSGRRDSNPRHPAWEATPLPTELRPHSTETSRNLPAWTAGRPLAQVSQIPGPESTCGACRTLRTCPPRGWINSELRRPGADPRMVQLGLASGVICRWAGSQEFPNSAVHLRLNSGAALGRGLFWIKLFRLLRRHPTTMQGTLR